MLSMRRKTLPVHGRADKCSSSRRPSPFVYFHGKDIIAQIVSETKRNRQRRTDASQKPTSLIRRWNLISSLICDWLSSGYATIFQERLKLLIAGFVPRGANDFWAELKAYFRHGLSLRFAPEKWGK